VERRGRQGKQWVFDSAKVIQWLIDRAVANERQGYSDLKGLGAVRAQKLRVDTAKAEIELAKDRGDAISLEFAGRIWDALVVAFRSRVLSIPAKLAPILVAETDTIATRNVLEAEIHAALDELSHYNPDPAIDDIERDITERQAAGAEGDEPGGGTAPVDGEPVGGQVPASKSRKQRRTRRLADEPGTV
jgi:hypothetical protein